MSGVIGYQVLGARVFVKVEPAADRRSGLHPATPLAKIGMGASGSS